MIGLYLHLHHVTSCAWNIPGSVHGPDGLAYTERYPPREITQLLQRGVFKHVTVEPPRQPCVHGDSCTPVDNPTCWKGS